MLVEYIAAVVNSYSNGTRSLPNYAAYLTKIAVSVVVAVLNILGVDIVGKATIIFGIIILVPVLVLVVGGFIKLNLSGIVTPVITITSFSKFASILIWNLCGFDSAGNLAGNIKIF